jgi:type IV pilus assembly protein PilA
MLSSVKQRLDRDDEGFTLIELMVVVLIIAILLAIAIPTFLGARNGANARAAESNLRNALTAEQTAFTNNQTYSSDTSTAGMAGIESGITWTTSAPTAGNNVSVALGDQTNGQYLAVMLAAFGKDGNCYYILQSNDPTNSFTGYGVSKQSNGCNPPAVPTTLPSTTAVQGNGPGAAQAANIAASGVPTKFFTSW